MKVLTPAKVSLFLAAVVLVMVSVAPFAGAQGSAPSVGLGSVALAANTTGTVTFSFTGTTVVASVNVLTQGAPNLDFTLNSGAAGTCAANTYNNGDTCTVGVTFTALAPGLRLGAVVLAASSGTPLATGLLQGTGTRPQAVGPGVMTKVTGPTAMNIPFELATDASGNLYFGNFNGNSVYKETLTGNTFRQTVVDSSLSHPAGLAVDGAGNVFISDQSNLRIVKETRNVLTGGYTQSVAVSGVGTAYGFAMDGAGNLYAGANTVIYLETPTGTGSYTQTQILSGFNFVVGLALDGSGNIFVADAGSGNVYAETLSGGSYTQTVMDSGLNNPNGIAVDAAGNVYVASLGS